MDPATVSGTIRTVVFQNEENGYAVVRLVTDEGARVVVTGVLPAAAPGERLVAAGAYTVHPQYGEQFAAAAVDRYLPSEEEDIVRFLSSGLIRGVGESTARAIVGRFGTESCDILEQSPEQLLSLKGMTEARAREIGERFRALMGTRRLLEFLARYELSAALCVPLRRRFGDKAREALRENPYLLAGDPFRVEFARVDEIAFSMGHGEDSPLRRQAGILFELSHNETNRGHVFLPRDKLALATARLLHCEPAAAGDALDALLETGEVVREPVGNVEACYIARCHRAETEVAARLRALCADRPARRGDTEKAIEEAARQQGIEYAPLQRLAVERAAEEPLLLLTGGPGTGKTTTVRCILALFEQMRLRVLLAAPTGRAAQRMGEVCGRGARTLHRMLGMNWDERSGAVTFSKNESDPLEADAVIVDEMSMVDLALMRAFLAAVRPGCRLVLVGDPDQLPSVGAGNVFSDMLRSGRFAVVALRDVFRQAERSAIVRSAHAVNEGRVPVLTNSAASDFFFMPRRQPERLVDTVVELCRKRLPENMGIPAEELQVLSPTRRGPTGTEALNRALQQALNPSAPGRRELAWGSLLFREGDRVMQIRNNYDIPWAREDGSDGLGVFNGDVGRILRIDGDTMTVAFDDRIAAYTAEAFSELDIAYAITVHKAQGSEYRGVVFVGAPCAKGLMTRGVLYTAITRARELLVVVGEEDAIAAMTANDRRTRRYSGLCWRLRHFDSDAGGV